MTSRQRVRDIVPFVVTMLLLGACQAGPPVASYPSSDPLAQPSWAEPANAMALVTEAGLVPETKEYLTTHLHAHLDVFVDGQAVRIPAGLGITIGAAGVRDEMTDDGTEHQYFVDTCATPCLSPLHTHDPSGTIHQESRTANHPPYTLGAFFTQWGVKLDANCVGEYCTPDALIHVYLNGKAYRGNPAEIPLERHLEVAIVIGQAPSIIPAKWEFLDAE